MGIVEKAGKAAGIVTGLALVLRIKGKWNETTGKLDKLDVLGIPVFDRRRMEARRARRRK